MEFGEGSLFKALPPIDAPQGAIAEAHQRRNTTVMLAPRGIETRILPSTPTSYTVPHAQSAMWFKELFAGYMSAQFCGYAADATSPLKLIAAETTELSTAATTKTVMDASLPARRVGIWLLAACREHSMHAEFFLDALSTWSQFKTKNQKAVNYARMTALFGADAEFFLSQTKHERSHEEPFTPGTIRILVRWNTGVQMQSVSRDVLRNGSVLGGTGILRELQDTVVRLSGCYDVPLPAELMNPVPERLLPQAFFSHLRIVSDEFFNMLEGMPSITKSKQALERKDGRALQSTNLLVRVVDKRLGTQGINDASCFHGAVLGFGEKREDIIKFANQSDDYGLRLPISKEELELGLHLCAVQAEGYQLGPLVSLFGTTGIAGKPIHSPSSWVWVARPAIRPIDAGLLDIFNLYPCEKQALIPGREELVQPFERFWNQTTGIYRLMCTNDPTNQTIKPCTSTDSIDSVATVRVPSPKEVMHTCLRKEDMFLLAAMQVDMKSERTTIGDAYAHIVHTAGSTAITQNMKQAMADLGVRASLYDMFVHNQKALIAYRAMDDATQKSNDCLLELCNAALDMAPGAKRARTINPQEALCLSAERMRRILKACSLKGGDHLTLEHNREANAEVLQRVVATATGASALPNSPAAALMKRPFAKLGDKQFDTVGWLERIEQAVAMAAATAVVTQNSTSARLFFVVGTVKAEEILIKTVELDGTIHGGSLDDMCRVKEPRVIIVQQLDEARVRVTATTPIA